MNVILLLFMIGIVLLVFEVVVPGAVLGVLGGLSMLAGCVLAFAMHGPLWGTLASLAAVGLLGLTLYFELVLLPKSRLGRQMLVHSTVHATSQAPLAGAEVVGQTCVALTPLVPSGYVELAGRRYEAFCRSGHVRAGETLRVVGVDNFRLILTKDPT